MKHKTWKSVALCLLSAMAGVAWQSYFASNFIVLGLFYGLSALTWIFFANRLWKQIDLTAPMVATFFCIGSLSCLANQSLESWLTNKLLNSQGMIAIVEQIEENKQIKSARKFKCVLRVKKLKTEGIWNRIYSKLRIILIKSDVDLSPGQKVYVNTKRLILLSSPKNLSTQAVLWRSGIATSAIPKKWSVKPLRDPDQDFDQQIIKFRESFLSRISKNFSGASEKLYTSVFMGKKVISPTDAEKEYFGIWGLSHFLARSGLHMAIFAGIVWISIQYIPFLTLWLKSLFVLLMLMIYSMLSWPSISFLRSCWMLALVMTGKALGERCSSPHIISLVCLWVILSNPFELFCADFQLSFSLAFGLIMATGWLKKEPQKRVQDGSY